MNDERRNVRHCVRVIFTCMVIQACTGVVSLIVEGIEWNNPCQDKSFKLSAWLLASGVYHWFSPFVLFDKIRTVTSLSARGTYPHGLMTRSWVVFLGGCAILFAGLVGLAKNDDCLTEPTALGIWSVIVLAVYAVTSCCVVEVSNSLYLILKEERNAALQREDPVAAVDV